MTSINILHRTILRNSSLKSVKLCSQGALLRQLNFQRTAMTSTIDWKPIKSHNNPNDMNSGNGSNQSGKKSGIGKKIALGLMIAMPVISFYLGTWQMRRLDWKTKLIAECETKLTYPPINLPKNFTVDMCEDWEYRKIKVKGHFVYEEELFVGPRARNGEKGYILFTPFIRSDTGEKILVERGWVSEEHVPPENRSLHHLSIPNPNKDIELVCLVRPPKERGRFQWEKTDPDSRLWQVADIFDMSKSVNCKPINFQAIYDLSDHPEWRTNYQNTNKDNDTKKNQEKRSFLWKLVPYHRSRESNNNSNSNINEEEINEFDINDKITGFTEWQFMKAGVPIGKKPTVDLRNNHLQYLVTWYGLSFLSSIFLIVALRKYWWKGNVVSQLQLKQDKLRHSKRFS